MPATRSLPLAASTMTTLLLLPATASANGMGALARFAAYVVLVVAPSFALLLTTAIVAAVIGRRATPRSPGRLVAAWVCVVLSLLAAGYMVVMPIWPLGSIPTTELLLNALFALVLAVGPLLLAVRALRRQRRQRP